MSSIVSMKPALLPKRDNEDHLRPPKRQKILFSTAENDLQFDCYTIAWVCVLHIETVAALAMLDERHGELPRSLDNNNTYTLGSIGSHNVVVVSIVGNRFTNNISTTLVRTFPSIRSILMVGVGGAAPATRDIRLGDVVVGTSMVQYKLGIFLSGIKAPRKVLTNVPDNTLRTVISNLRARHEFCGSRVPAILEERMQSDETYNRPSAPDLLFQSSYKHNSPLGDCQTCDQSQLEGRDARSSCEPKIHYGTIASSNRVIKDAVIRDRVAQELDAICFEMEAAGLMIEGLSCLQIRGICDYSDSHKAKDWQRYAAAVAAAYARELLETLPATVDMPRDSLSNARNRLGDRRQRLLDSLNFDAIGSRKAMIKPPHSTTCRWILDHPDYLAWLGSYKQPQHHGILWVRGKPGAGKSTIMKFMSINQKETNIPKKTVTISFFFNARGELLEKSVLGMFRSLLLQVLQGFPDLQHILDEPIARSQIGCPPLNTLKVLFRSAISSLKERVLTCFVDALDECGEKQVMDAIYFFEDLAERCVEDNVRFKVCFSSRYYPYIDVMLGIQLTLEDQDGHTEDIKRYISKSLQIKESKVAEKLKQITLREAGGIFLWVVLVVDILNAEYRHGRLDLRRRLQQMPGGISGLSKDLLARDQENMVESLISILLILLAQRPLGPEEFYHALWSELSSRDIADREMPPVDRDCSNRCVISSTKGLAKISKAKKPIVQFGHPLVRNFLVKKKGLHRLWPELGTDYTSQGHEILKSSCNTYVFHEAVGKAIEADTTKGDLLNEFPFLEYASQFVLSHAEAAANMISQQTFIRDFPVTKWVRIFNIFGKYEVRKFSPDADILYILADMGLPNLIRARLKVTPGIDEGGGIYRHSLLAAMAKGHRDSVAALLDLPSRIFDSIGLECKVDSVTKDHTPFSWACEEGHMVIANLLLQKGARIIEADLVRVLKNGHIELATMLLYKGADATAADKNGRTPLHEASQYGFLEIARMLLEKGADPSAMDQLGLTPLHLASENGHRELVQTLLVRGAKDFPTIRADRAARGDVQALSAIPQTDSGYVSTAANVIHDKDFVDDCVDDTSTEYSTTSSMNFLEADIYIAKFARHLARHTSGLTAEKETQNRICTILPSLLKAFALQVGHQTHNPFSRTVMAFVHMYRGEIAETFRDIQFSQDDEALPRHSEPSASDDTIDRRGFLDAWIERVESPPAGQEDEQIYQSSPEPASREQSPEQEEASVDSPLLFEESAVLQTTAFDWLLSRLLKEFHLTPTKPYAMQSIGKSILAALPPVRSISRKTLPPTYHVSIELECKLFQFFERQKYSRHPHEVLDGVITLTGSLNDSQAATCGQYLSQTWPSTAPYMIELLKDCLMVKHGCPRTMLYPDGTTLKLRVQTSELIAEVNGVAATVAEIGEQLAWLGATFRERPEKDGLAYCTPDIITLPNDPPSSQLDLRPSQDVVFRIRFLVEMDEGNQNMNGQCWHSLFKSSIIVKGYPIPRRNEWNVGLEANLEIMAGLARVDQIHTFDDRFYIKGYSTILVPTRRSNDIQYWHLIHQTDGGRLSHFASDTVEDRYVGSPNDLEQFRHILGWCSQAESFSGLFNRTRTLVTCSMLPKCAKDAVLAGEVYKRGRPVPKTFNFFPVTEDTAPSISSSDLFFRLRLLEAQFFLLWDEKEKRGWLVNGATALLHAVEECIEPDMNGDSRSVVLFRGQRSGKTCDNYRRSALQILNDEKYQNLPLYGQEIGHATIRDKIKELCSILEYFVDLQNHAKTNDRLHGQSRKYLEGWDFEDLVSNFRPFHARQTTLEKLGKEWVDFIRAIKAVTLFGQDFGDIIRPHGTCQQWTTLPNGRYYIATLISDLHKVLKEHGNCGDGHLRLGDNLIWHSVTPGSGFCKCKEVGQDTGKDDRCEPVQTCLPLKMAGSLKSGKSRIPDDNEGALIFGHHSQFPWFWDDTGDPKKGQDDEVFWSPTTTEKRILSPDSGIGSSMSRSQTETGDQPRASSEDSFAEPPLKKRKATTHVLPPEISSPNNKQESHVGIICALPHELAAVRATFDVTLKTYMKVKDDNNCYFTGKIAHHNVVATCLPILGMGTNDAASTAKDMRRSFSPSLCLLVGIGGGVPSEEHDIRLGDVVVGTSIIQYDFGSETEENFRIKDRVLQSSPPYVGSIVSSLCSEQGLIRSSIDQYLAEIIAKDGMTQYYRPGHDRDVLALSCLACRSVRGPCNHVKGREKRKDPVVKVHYGKIASGNRVIKCAVFRDEIAAKHNVRCFEMEGAGIANTMPYLVVRGISDYCDGNKNDEWHKYAAATAAAYAKLLLSKYHY